MGTLRVVVGVLAGALGWVMAGSAGEFELELRSQRRTAEDPPGYQRVVRAERWSAEQTAVIVCDVWDLHHCLNAVRRLEEFAPRLDLVLAEARRRGAVIIHSPSDCMPAYSEHPARRRALAAPRAAMLPKDIEFWCSRIPSEEQAAYPIDQSDGGEDDDPAEHAEWSARLESLGRNPRMPWKKQSHLITIDADHDYISDRGDEVWNVLEHRGIRNVILTGVHCNMCVLGRPFGLRQLVRNGKNVVLMRDMTDSMYNPQRWPFVDHFTGNDLVVSHVERFICPTVSSDQVLGGGPFRWKADKREHCNIAELPRSTEARGRSFSTHWTTIPMPSSWETATSGQISEYAGIAWYRCAVRIPRRFLQAGQAAVSVPGVREHVQLWVNGHTAVADPELQASRDGTVYFPVSTEWIAADDANLIVVRVGHSAGSTGWSTPPIFLAGPNAFPLKGRWQFRLDDDPTYANMPLPARFGASTDILHELTGLPASPLRAQ